MPYHGHEPECTCDIEQKHVEAQLSSLQSSYDLLASEYHKVKQAAEALRKVLETQDQKLHELWGKSDNPHAEAYGWVKIMKEEALEKLKKLS